MKKVTLHDVIKENVDASPKFAELYAREQVINDIAKLIFNARKSEKLTQAELARRIHTTQSVIARAESGNDSRIPSVDLLMRIASASHMKMNIQFKPQARASVGR